MVVPSLCVVDTNVPITANGDSSFSEECAEKCREVLRHMVAHGRVAVDNLGLIFGEYERHLSSSGEPGVGDKFYKWVSQNYGDGTHCYEVPITPKDHRYRDFHEFPRHPGLSRFHQRDRKFVAVSAANPDHPPILEATDTQWWEWKEPLRECGIEVVFVCQNEIEQRYHESLTKNKRKKKG